MPLLRLAFIGWWPYCFLGADLADLFVEFAPYQGLALEWTEAVVVMGVGAEVEVVSSEKVSSGFGVLVPWPNPGCFVMTLHISSFQKSSLKYAKSVFSLSMMSVNEDLHNSTVVGMPTSVFHPGPYYLAFGKHLH